MTAPALAPQVAPIDAIEIVRGQASTLDEVVFASAHLWPTLLVGLVCIGLLLWAARTRNRAIAALGNHVLVRRLIASVHPGYRLVTSISVVGAVFAISLGLLRLQYGGSAKVVPASGLDIVLAVDYSKSMLARDVYPSRSERLEAELSRFLDDADRRGDRVGVVVFAGGARGFPVTRDVRLLKLYLRKADPKTEQPGGTNLGRALNVALTFLVDARRAIGPNDDVQEARNRGQPPGSQPVEIPEAETDQAIVLLTDGEDNASRPIEVAKAAAKLGVRVFTVGIGSKSGEPIQKFDEDGEPDGFVVDEDGEFVVTRLDTETLEIIAKETGGAYVEVDPDTFSLDEVRAKLESLSRSQRQDEIEIAREEGFHFAVIAALLLLSLSLGLGDRRKASVPPRRT
ncbi:MAG: VWA domain-containing protein [Nannocystaceae bacterium]|nr:VWA domain-containing protein [Nannocystaceae bacterium]